MLRLGDYNTLRIVKTVDFGLYLDGGEEGEILLPQRYVTKDMHVGDEIEVFLYLDQEERPVATTERPYAKVGEFAYLEVACGMGESVRCFPEMGTDERPFLSFP